MKRYKNMQVVKALHITPTDRRLLEAFTEQVMDNDITSPGDGVGTKRISMTLLEKNGDVFTISRKQKMRDDWGNPKSDYSKIIIKIGGVV